MNKDKDGPAKAWTPTEGSRFAIQTSDHTLSHPPPHPSCSVAYAGTKTVTSLTEDVCVKGAMDNVILCSAHFCIYRQSANTDLHMRALRW